MGWKGTLRSVGAAMRAADREAQRRARLAHKDRVASASADAVNDLDEHVEGLLSIHTDLSRAIDWRAMAVSGKPVEPERIYQRSGKLEKQLQNFRPGALDFLRGGAKKRFSEMERKYAAAWDEDEAAFQRAFDEYDQALQEWEADRSLAKRVIAGEKDALLEVISEHQSLTDEGRIGSYVSFDVADGYVHAKPEVHSLAIMPRIRRKQLASGALSESQMPVGQHNDLYQDYVASVALRVGGDLFNIIPIDEVYVSCISEMLNPATGHQEKQPIVSVHFVRKTFVNLNLASIDPSQALGNFRHNMRYKRTSGFQPVEPIALSDK